MAPRLPQSVHEPSDASPAPADLEPLRSFLALHDHEAGNPDSLPPGTDSLRWWLVTQGLVTPSARISGSDLRWASEVRDALRARVREEMGAPRDDHAIAVLDRALERARVRPGFGAGDDADFRVDARGVVGAVGRLLASAVVADLDGRWQRFRICGDATCGEVFYDHSRNRSGKWCSMAVCGNRAKVRAFRERNATG